MPAEFTVLVDSREQHPLPIPATLHTSSGSRSPDGRVVRIHTLVRTLPTGDYQLSCATPLCTIERKGSPSELCKNLLSSDRARTLAAFDRLAALPNPVLLLECNAATLLKPSPQWAHNPGPAFDHLIHELSTRRISLFFIDTKSDAGRKMAGELVARLLLLHQHPPLKESAPCQDPVASVTVPTSPPAPQTNCSTSCDPAPSTSPSSSPPPTPSPASTPTTTSSTASNSPLTDPTSSPPF